MASEEKKHEVVISGISGLFPESDDVNELWERLLNKEDMITIDGRRWMPGEFDVPPGTGKIRHPDKFDMAFFGVHRRLCEKMDPYARLECEQAYRAVCDAGVNPGALDGTNTAVIMSCFLSEPENDLASCMINMGTYNVLAVSRTMQANRISYFMNLKGPSFSLDCQGCGGFVAIQHACDMISNGMCNAAIVGCCSLFHKPEPSFHFKVMGRLSDDAVTRSFSADASGYARSEGCVTMFLQRKDMAKRIYGTILAVDVFTHGSKTDQFCEFPVNRYEEYLKEVYRKAKVDPKDVSYLEAYGAASKKLDALELNVLSKFMLSERKEPLLIGSVKSNLGHAEGASAMISLTKVLLAMDRGVIPPNINYSEPNPDVPDLVSGKFKVVTEPTPVPGNVMAISEIGFTGVCSHMIVKRWEKIKSVEETENFVKTVDSFKLPFLMTMSGRSQEAVVENMSNFTNGGVDAEFAILVNDLYRNGVKSHAYRGYTVISDSPNAYNMTGSAPSSEKRPIWFMYSGMGSQWPTMGKTLMALPVFAEAIHKCHNALLPKGVDLLEIVTKDDLSMFDVILNSFVGIAAVQIGLTDVLRAVGVQPDGIIGHSVGELGCAYADDCLTAEQMILAAHARGRASVEATLIKGMMAAVGAGYNIMKSKVPESIEVACHNSKESCTLSGPADDMSVYIAQLKSTGMFAKLVNVANIAYHSRYITPAAPALLKYLKEIIPVPKKRSSKWVSSSNLEINWNTELAQYSSAEYHTNNLLSAVLFEEASIHIPSNAIVIEIAPHGLLQAIVKKSIPHATHIPLTSRFDANNLMYLLAALGKMYLSGIPVNIQGLYPHAEFPVARNTPAISPLIDWLRDENFCIRRGMNDLDYPSPICRFVNVEKGKKTFNKLNSHKLKGRTILPFSFYFNNILSVFTSLRHNEDEPVLLEDFGLIGSVAINPDSTKEIRFHLLPGTGSVAISDFEHDTDLVGHARIKVMDAAAVTDLVAVNLTHGQTIIARNDMMEFMKSMGIEREAFINVDDIVIEEFGISGVARWTGDLGDFVASLLSLVEFYVSKRDNVLKLFYRAAEMRLNLPLLHQTSNASYSVKYSESNKTLECEGVRISLIECQIPPARPVVEEADVLFDCPKFIPYHNEAPLSVKDFVDVCTQLVIENTENTPSTLIKIMEVGEDSDLLAALREVTSNSKYVAKTPATRFTSEDSFLKLGIPMLLQKDVWLVFDSPPSQEILKYLTIFKNGFVLMPSNTSTFNNPAMRVIFESCVNNKRYSLLSMHPNYSTRQYEVVNLNHNFLSNLRLQLEKVHQVNGDSQATKTVILMGEVDSVISVKSIVEETKELPNYQALQFWFFVGTTPSFNSDDNMKTQLERRVKINVSVSGVWGSLRLFPVQVVEVDPEIERVSTFHHPFSAVLQSGDLQAIGLNLPDSSNESKFDLGLYDYVTDESMGIGTYDAHVKGFNPHKSLSWKKPSRWTPAEAATVPYHYSLASYIINNIHNCVNEFYEQESILINRGLMPLSQALIAMALYSKLTVYASVYGEEEKRQLLKLFPQLDKNNIYDCSTTAFFVDVLRETQGVYKVINNFETAQMVEPCAKCTSPWGVIVYTNQALIDKGAKMGMSVFLGEIMATGASSSLLWKSSDDLLEQIRQDVEDAIGSGAVKPIPTITTLMSSTLNTDAANFLKRVPHSKVIVERTDQMSTVEKKVYLQDETLNHVVLEGKAPGGLSLDIVEWLLKRGCRRVVLFTRQGRSLGSIALRLQTLRDQYNKAEIIVKPISYLSSKSNVDKFVRECPGRGPSMAFFIGAGLKDKIEQFDEILIAKAPTCTMICIGNECESISEHRKTRNLPTLYARCSMSTLENVNLTRYLDSLVRQSPKVPVVFIDKYNVQTLPSCGIVSDFTRVPDSPEELFSSFDQCPPTAKFVEVRTLAPRHHLNREVYPVFMIPGLRPGKLRKMASQLYSPAFEARLPARMCNLEEMASVLAGQLLTTPQNMFTIVAESWGGILALLLALKLEKQFKTVNVIFVDAAPASVNKWANQLLKNDVALIGKYLRVSPEDYLNMKNMTWDAKVQLAIRNSGLTHEGEKKLIEDCLNMLRSRLESVSSLAPPRKKVKSKCHVLQLSSESEEERGLHHYLEQEPVIHLKEAGSVSEMIDSEASHEVNTLHLFEYPDAANPPIDEYMGLNVVKKPGWYSSLLYRVID